MAAISKDSEEQYKYLANKLATLLEGEDWDTEHVEFVILKLVEIWWHRRIGQRTITEVPGVLTNVTAEFRDRFVKEYKLKKGKTL